MRDDFAVFIITHGRPDKQLTYNALRRCGYSGKIYVVVDDTDDTIQQYIDLFGTDDVIVFNKNYYINDDRFDNGTNVGIYECAVYARRAVEDIAKSFGLDYFVMADDDLVELVMRYNIDNQLKRIKITDLDAVFDTCIEFLSCNNIGCLGFSSPAIFFNKCPTIKLDGLLDLPLNLFIRKVACPVNWSCWFGEDDIAAVHSNRHGIVWINIPFVMRDIAPLGSGAMSSTYNRFSSYERVFSKFRYTPDCFVITLNLRGQMFGQYTLKKKPGDLFPKIISDMYKKED